MSGEGSRKIASDTVREFHEFPLTELAAATQLNAPIKPTSPRPFDLERCLEDFVKGVPTPPGENSYPQWAYEKWHGAWLSKFGSLSREEAHFWIIAATLTLRITDTQPAEASVAELRRFTYDGSLSLEQAKERIINFVTAAQSGTSVWYTVNIEFLAHPLRELFGLSQAFGIIFEAFRRDYPSSYLPYLGPPYEGAEGAAEEAKLAEVVGAIVPKLNLSDYLDLNIAQGLLKRAPHQGALRSALDQMLVSAGRYYRAQLFDLAFLIDSDEEYLAYIAKVDSDFDSTQIIRLVARTGFAHLDVAIERALKHGRKWQRSSVFPTFTKIHSPTLAPAMLDIATASSTSTLHSLSEQAEAWLLSEGANAVSGLLPLALSRSKQREPARAMLKKMLALGQREIVAQEIAKLPAKARAVLEPALLDSTKDEVKPTAIDGWPSFISRFQPIKENPALFDLEKLPALRAKDGSLAPDQVAITLIRFVSDISIPDDFSHKLKLDPRIAELTDLLDHDSLVSFASAFVENFFKADAPKDQRWIMRVVIVVPDVRVIQTIEPHLRSITWRYSDIPKTALIALRYAATADAINLIADLRNSVHETGIESLVASLLLGIEKERDLDEEALLDLCVPTCELDSKGSFSFDYGAHKYQLIVRGVGEFGILDQAGHTLKTLPTPHNDDDQAKVDIARKQYRQVSSHLRQVFAQQIDRLERAMIDGRVWLAKDWKDHVVAHPVMVHFARGLVWCAVDESGNTTSMFRTTEDGSFADLDDNECTLADDAHLKIVHPLMLDAQLISRWTDLLNDYKIMQPFAQMARSLYRVSDPSLPPSEGKDLAPQGVVKAMRQRGWDLVRAGGWRYNEFVRTFTRHRTVVKIAFSPGIGNVTGSGYGTQTLGPLRFYELNKKGDETINPNNVSPIVFSESFNDLQHGIDAGAAQPS